MFLTQLQPPQVGRLPENLYRRIGVQPLGDPYWLDFNTDLAAEIGLDNDVWQSEPSLLFFSGSLKQPPHIGLATVYSGHQFGVYVPQLGDGRALSVGDWLDPQGQRWEWQLKGAGMTPFSRRADGRAVLRSSIREYLCSEAMHGLGIATTRALALTGSNDAVYREQVETAAVVTRVAPSFIRFGHFEYLYHSGRHEQIQTLADYVMDLAYPECRQAEQPYLALFTAISQRSAELVAAWQSVGFCHGVLNSDNMSVLGLTLDYGPFGFLDAFDWHHVCNHSDTGGRYAYNQQPYIVQWNLSCLASAFLPLVAEADLVAVLNGFAGQYQAAYGQRMRAKLGFQTEQAEDGALIKALLDGLQQQQVDFTRWFRALATVTKAGEGLPEALAALLQEPSALASWCADYRHRLAAETATDAQRAAAMNAVNPHYVLRNHLLEQAIAAAKQGDHREIARLRQCLRQPFTEEAAYAAYAELPPAWAKEIAVSCSS